MNERTLNVSLARIARVGVSKFINLVSIVNFLFFFSCKVSWISISFNERQIPFIKFKIFYYFNINIIYFNLNFIPFIKFLCSIETTDRGTTSWKQFFL